MKLFYIFNKDNTNKNVIVYTEIKLKLLYIKPSYECSKK
jgi:hypothetical protein